MTPEVFFFSDLSWDLPLGRDLRLSNLIIQYCWSQCYSGQCKTVSLQGRQARKPCLVRSRSWGSLRKVGGCMQTYHLPGKKLSDLPASPPWGCGWYGPVVGYSESFRSETAVQRVMEGHILRHNPRPFWKKVSLKSRIVLTVLPAQIVHVPRIIQGDTDSINFPLIKSTFTHNNVSNKF